MTFSKTLVALILAVFFSSVAARFDIGSLLFYREDSSEENSKHEPIKRSHHLVIGSRVNGDSLVDSQKLEEKYLLSGKKLIRFVDINLTENEVITEIRCMDQATDDTGAEVVLAKGGPGNNFVSLRFKSQRWHGIYFNIEVYAKRKSED